jgi:hypothetical protein
MDVNSIIPGREQWLANPESRYVSERFWIPDLAALARDDSERPLDNYRYRIIFTQSFATRGMSADMLACGAGSAPAVAACNRRIGTLIGTVRGQVTDALPFLAGRGLGRAEIFRPRRGFNPLPRRIPSASREARAARQAKSPRPRKHRPLSEKPPNWSAAKRQPLEREATEDRLRQAALRSLFNFSTPGAGNCALELKAFVFPEIAKRLSGMTKD